MIYLDNAATYYPKAKNIPDAISSYLCEVVSSPGRGGHSQGAKAAQLLEDTRKLLCRHFNGRDPSQFHFIYNATHGLNCVIQGLLATGDHVVTTALEHNSVLRPIRKMCEERGVKADIVPSNPFGQINPQDVIQAIRPETRLVVLNHASNVFGTVLDLKPILMTCARLGVRTLIDASQSAGLLDIDLQTLPLDFLVATGHKALRGPSGTGFLFAKNTHELSCLMVGGTGGNSLSLWQPQNQHALFESGTPNYLGIAGFKVALEELAENPADLASELELAKYIDSNLRNTNGVDVYGPDFRDSRIPLLSFNIAGWSPQETLAFLDDEFGIIVRAGLHCAPIAHLMAGTLPGGTVRISLSHTNTKAEATTLLKAVERMAHAR
jgi:cysteine desulfurase family protein